MDAYVREPSSDIPLPHHTLFTIFPIWTALRAPPMRCLSCASSSGLSSFFLRNNNTLSSSSHPSPPPPNYHNMRPCCCQIYRFLLNNAPPQSPPPLSPTVTRRCVSEVGAEMAATCVALCCCPLAVVHLVLLLLVVYPCTFFIKQARKVGARCNIGYAKRRAGSPTPSESGKAKFDPLHGSGESPPNNSWKKPMEISVGFVIQFEGSRVVAFRRTLGCCGLQVPASLKRRIGVWKEKRLVGLGKWRCGSKRVHSRRGVDGTESDGSSIDRCSSRREGNESSTESEEGLGEKDRGFQHPFWKECFEGGSVGFWRGLNLCESTRRCLQSTTAGN